MRLMNPRQKRAGLVGIQGDGEAARSGHRVRGAFDFDIDRKRDVFPLRFPIGGFGGEIGGTRVLAQRISPMFIGGGLGRQRDRQRMKGGLIGGVQILDKYPP